MDKIKYLFSIFFMFISFTFFVTNAGESKSEREFINRADLKRTTEISGDASLRHVTFNLGLLHTIRPKYTWYNPVSWFWCEPEPGVRDTIKDIGETARTASATLHGIQKDDLPKVRDALDQIGSLAKTIREGNQLGGLNERIEGLNGNVTRFLNMLETIPPFMKLCIQMIVSGAVSYQSIRYMVMPGINKLIKAYSDPTVSPELKKLAWLQTLSGVAVGLASGTYSSHSWRTFNSRNNNARDT